MINPALRREAGAIANGTEANAELPAKVAVYGLYAECLRGSDLNYTPLPAVRSFSELKVALVDRMTEAITDGYEDMSASRRSALNHRFEQLYAERSLMGLGSPLGRTALQRLDNGVDTAAYTEAITMRTVASRLGTGQQVSERGLYSAQVPLRLSLLSLQHIGSVFRSIVVHDIVAPSGGDIFARSYVDLDFHKGLVFSQSPDPHEQFEYAAEPQLGCPASMVQKYIHDLHCLAVQASLEGGLLDTSQIIAT